VRIGVTGHTNLSQETTRLVAEAIRRYLRSVDDGELVGVSCLARGADSVFAQAVVELGGDLEVVLPSPDYREAEVHGEHAAQFDALLDQAARVRTIEDPRDRRTGYAAANDAVLDSVDELVAVWDGVPAAEVGGTADMVRAARRRRIPITVIWPRAAARTTALAAPARRPQN
jgi:hypothetical protein